MVVTKIEANTNSSASPSGKHRWGGLHSILHFLYCCLSIYNTHTHPHTHTHKHLVRLDLRLSPPHWLMTEWITSGMSNCCKLLTSTSAVWGSVSCPRTLWHADQGKRTSDLLITRHLINCLWWCHSRSCLGLLPHNETHHKQRSRSGFDVWKMSWWHLLKNTWCC